MRTAESADDSSPTHSNTSSQSRPKRVVPGSEGRKLMMANALTPPQLEILQRYLDFEASLEEVRLKLRGVLEFESASEDGTRRMDCNFPPSASDARVARQRLEAALLSRRGQRMSEEELIEWATSLFFCHPYDWDIEDEGTDTDWVKKTTIELMAGDS
jgi:hypothetical protein